MLPPARCVFCVVTSSGRLSTRKRFWCGCRRSARRRSTSRCARSTSSCVELGEELYDSGRLHRDTPERARLYHARSALGARGSAAANRLGTDRPSELASAFYRLSPAAYAHRAKLLDGVRLLPLGRFYDGGRDVYPAIVESWCGVTKTLPAAGASAPGPAFRRLILSPGG